MASSFAAALLKKLIPGLEVPHGLRMALPNELASLLPFSYPILETRDRSVEDRALVLHVGVGFAFPTIPPPAPGLSHETGYPLMLHYVPSLQIYSSSGHSPSPFAHAA